ncbi:MAG: sulfatase-like hydrolase/transferase [Thermoanaerobaculia bacterium]
MRRLRRSFVPFLLSLLAAGCSRTEPAPPVVLISIDTLRSDRLRAWGYTAGDTPALDALARESILFEHAFAEVPLTLPSHASLFSGRLPPVHGVRDNVGFPFADAAGPLLAERLRAAGYATFGAVSSRVLSRDSGIARGFDLWDEPGGAAVGGEIERPGGRAVEAARRWLGRRSADARPPFLFLHFYEPHAPYRPPEPFRTALADPYDGEIAAADRLVGEVLTMLRGAGLLDRAVLLVLSDHGEGLGDHGEDEHGILLHREALQVPLLLRLPGVRRAGERVPRDVALVDVVPTLLELLSLSRDPTLPGVSLLATDVAPDRPLYAETIYPLVHFGWSDLASVVAGRRHLISGTRSELFDLERDPAETIDRRAEERRAAAAMERFLAGIDREVAAPAAADAETLATLGALGYLGRSALPADRTNLADPRDRVRAIAPLLHGMRLYREGDYEGAVAVLTEASRAADALPHVWQFLGASLDALGRRTEAAAAYEHGSRTNGSPSYLAESAVLRLLELDRLDAAITLAAEELVRHPESAILRVLLSRALLQSGRIDEAARAADEAIARAPDLADARYQRAVVAMARRDGGAAIPDLERAIALDGRHLQARKALAVLRFAQGDRAAAERLLGEVLAIDPDDADARSDLDRLRSAGGP